MNMSKIVAPFLLMPSSNKLACWSNPYVYRGALVVLLPFALSSDRVVGGLQTTAVDEDGEDAVVEEVDANVEAAAAARLRHTVVRAPRPLATATAQFDLNSRFRHELHRGVP